MSTEQLTLLIAGASLALSVASMAWTIGWSMWTHSKSTKPQLKVSASHALVMFHGAGASTPHLAVAVVNTGAVPVTLGGIRLRIVGDPRNETIVPNEWMQTRNAPPRLEVGQPWEAPLVPTRSLIAALQENFADLKSPDGWRLQVVVSDAAGTKFEEDLVLAERDAN